MAAVNLINVEKKIGNTPILNQININVSHGEFIAVVGPSGCGKTTLLRLIAGLEELSAGSILINDQCVNKIPGSQRDMAMVFQNYALYPHMSVFDNMAYSLKLRRLKKTEIQKKVHEAAELLSLTPYLNRKPSALSGGQKQRVAMGRAIVRSPSVFLFDEPLSNLDAKLRATMRHEIRRLHKQLDTTSIYVTHDQTEAMTMADRVVVLNKGSIEQIDTPKVLYQKPNSLFVAAFTGQYPINTFPGIFDKNTHAAHTPLGIYAVPKTQEVLEDNEELILAIRSEHVVIATQNGVPVQVEFVDNMGSDKLIRTKLCANGQAFCLRVSADQEISSGQFFIELAQTKLHFFKKNTGKTIGGYFAL